MGCSDMSIWPAFHVGDLVKLGGFRVCVCARVVGRGGGGGGAGEC